MTITDNKDQADQNQLIYEIGQQGLYHPYRLRQLSRNLRLKNNIVIMRAHQTYSLNTILSANQLQPQIYQQIIHDIKSPIQQLSIDITNDNSMSMQHVPRRPNIPPPPATSPLANFTAHNFSRTHQSLSMQSPTKVKEIFHDEVIESVLSPLDQQITLKQQLIQSNGLWCGADFKSILYGDCQHEIQLPFRRTSKRRPIFNNNTLPSISRVYKPIPVAIEALQKIEQPELALLLKLLSDLEPQLEKISQQKQQMEGSLQQIYERLSQNSQYLPENLQRHGYTARVLRRLKAKSTGQLLTKVLKRDKNNSVSVDRQLQQLFEQLNRIEVIISSFLAEKAAAHSLDTIYSFLEHNFASETSLGGQLRSLINSLGVSLQLRSLELIWEKCNQRRLSRQEFIQGVTMNDLIVRSHKDFEQDLQTRGFSRNQ